MSKTNVNQEACDNASKLSLMFLSHCWCLQRRGFSIPLFSIAPKLLPRVCPPSPSPSYFLPDYSSPSDPYSSTSFSYDLTISVATDLSSF